MVNSNTKTLASFDVKSLFANISQKERFYKTKNDFTKQIILQKLFPDKATRFTAWIKNNLVNY